jgi:hypothetical protein
MLDGERDRACFPVAEHQFRAILLFRLTTLIKTVRWLPQTLQARHRSQADRLYVGTRNSGNAVMRATPARLSLAEERRVEKLFAGLGCRWTTRTLNPSCVLPQHRDLACGNKPPSQAFPVPWEDAETGGEVEAGPSRRLLEKRLPLSRRYLFP